MWFTYLVLFFHKVVLLGNAYAGLLILIGQVADAAATPIIGFFCDNTHVRYGRRKLWHLIGTVMVAASLFFFWHSCLGCENSPLAVKIVYFSIPIIIFQFGWASVQISHLSLIPELTSDKNERVGLNAIRLECMQLLRLDRCSFWLVAVPPWGVGQTLSQASEYIKILTFCEAHAEWRGDFTGPKINDKTSISLYRTTL